MLYTSCALYLWSQRKIRKTYFLLAYTTLLLVVETIFIVVQATSVQSVYIDNRNYPGGPWVYFLETQHLAVNVLFYAALYLLTFFSDMLMVSGPSTFSSSNSDYSNISCGAVGLSGLHLVILVV